MNNLTVTLLKNNSNETVKTDCLYKNLLILSSNKAYFQSNLFEDNILILLDGEMFHYNSLDSIYSLYKRHGNDTFNLIEGEWFLIIYNMEKDTLLCAQSHTGLKSIYYYNDDSIFIATNSLDTLLKKDEIDVDINYSYIVNNINHTIPFQYNETPYQNIFRLNTAHYIEVNNSKFSRNRYWFPEKKTKLNTITKDQAIEKIRILFFEAVKNRIKNKQIVTSMLSGGLDSSSVSIVASLLLKNQKKVLYTFSHVPSIVISNNNLPHNRIANEKIYIDKIINRFSNIKGSFEDSKEKSILDGTYKYIEYTNEAPAGPVIYWYLDILTRVKKFNSNIHLTGEIGNGTVSFRGDINKLSFISTLEKFGIKYTFKNKILKPLLFYKYTNLIYNHFKYKSPYINEGFKNKDFVLYNLLKKTYKFDDLRTRIIKPGFYPRTSILGSISTALNLYVTDPTSDKNLIEFIYQLPDEFFFNKEGDDKDLIKHFMKDFMPHEVLHQKTRGQQSSDIKEKVLLEVNEIEILIKNFNIKDFNFELFNKNKLLTNLDRIKKKELSFTDTLIFLNTIAQIQFINYVKENYEQPNKKK